MRPHISDKDKEALIAEMQGLIGPDDIQLMQILATNYRPHAYAVGDGHVRYARQHYGTEQLTEDIIREYERRGGHCAVGGCSFDYDSHSFELGLSVQLKRDLTSAELNKLFGRIKPLLITNNIKGMLAVPNEHGYQVLPDSSKKAKR